MRRSNLQIVHADCCADSFVAFPQVDFAIIGSLAGGNAPRNDLTNAMPRSSGSSTIEPITYFPIRRGGRD